MKSLLREALSWEKKKALLPLLMCLILFSSIIGLYHIRDSGYDTQVTDDREEIYSMSLQYSALRYQYNDSINATEYSEILDAKVETAEQDNPIKRKDFKGAVAPLFLVYRTPQFILQPSKPLILSKAENSLIFDPEKGYFLSREIPEMVIRSRYIQMKNQDLLNKSRHSNMSKQEYLSRFEESQNISTSRAARYIEEKTSDSKYNENMAWLANLDDSVDRFAIYQSFADEEVQEVKWYHFTPALTSTFVVYYLISGILIVGVRRFREN